MLVLKSSVSVPLSQHPILYSEAEHGYSFFLITELTQIYIMYCLILYDFCIYALFVYDINICIADFFISLFLLSFLILYKLYLIFRTIFLFCPLPTRFTTTLFVIMLRSGLHFRFTKRCFDVNAIPFCSFLCTFVRCVISFDFYVCWCPYKCRI